MSENKKFTRRSFFLLSLKTALFALLGINFYNIQILTGFKYKVLSDQNRIRVNILQPPRGIITDRNNEILVHNAFSYTASIDTTSNLDDVLYELNKICTIQSINIKKVENRSQSVLCNHLQWSDVAKIESNIKLNEIIKINPSYKRIYIYKHLLGYITGYTGIPNKTDIDKDNKDFVIGKNGLEMSCEDFLKGAYGIQKVEVNAFGNVIREISMQPSIQGNTIKSSIDLRIQKALHEINDGKQGIHIAMNIKTGEILGMYSFPGYDPNIFTTSIKTHQWNKFIQSPDKPLINKSISSLYPPGSTFKMITLLAILQSNIAPKESVFCSGEYKIGTRTLHCWKRYGHGYINAYNALENSCNIYFAVQSMKCGIDAIERIAKIFGLGHKTDIELPFEVTGLIPNKHWKYEKYKKLWNIGDTVNTSIGQGYNLTTPIQLAVMTSRIASGMFVHPTILCNQNNIFHNIDGIQKHHLHIVRESMYNVMRNHHWEGLKIAGKTGTAQVISKRDAKGRFKDHSMFVGFAPYDDPQYNVISIVENAGWGSDTALPMTKKIFQTLLSLK